MPLRVVLLCRSRPGGIQDRRAREIAARTGPRVDVEVTARPASRDEAVALVRRLARGPRPDVVVAYDANPRELGPALVARARGVPLIAETGDVGYALIAAVGGHPVRAAYREAVERASWHLADTLVVVSEGFLPVLEELGVRRPVEVVPEGVDTRRFRPLDPAPWRARLGLRDDELAAGVVGSIQWSAAGTAYGWELVDALPHTPRSVRAVIVGGGSGVEPLRERARSLGVEDRLVLTGPVPHEEVPGVLAALDVVTCTQTPDLVGRCRTTQKLPEYLACGKYVLATDVGVLPRYLRGNGRVLPYRGGRDLAYAAAVAAELTAFAGRRDEARRLGLGGVARAAAFDWDVVADRFVEVVERTVRRARRR